MLSKHLKFLQWNTRSVKQRFNDLYMLLTDGIDVAALQETWLRPADSFTVKNFHILRKDRPVGRSGGGVCLLISSSLNFQEIDLNIEIEAVAATIYFDNHEKLTLCSIYLPPNAPFTLQELSDLVNQLPSPFVLLGDFNAHHELWGSNVSCSRGHQMIDFITDHTLDILNDGSPTYLSNGVSSHLDLSLTSGVPALSWNTLDDLYDSDHYPIVIQSEMLNTSAARCRWKLKNVDWNAFAGRVNIPSEYLDADSACAEVTNSFITAAESTIKKTTGNVSPKFCKSWWTDDLKTFISKRKSALRKFTRHPTETNFIEYKKHRAAARREIRKAKRASWQSFISSIGDSVSSSTMWENINKIRSVKPFSPRIMLKDNDSLISDSFAVSNCFAEQFSSVSRIDNYCEPFLTHLNQVEATELHIDLNMCSSYNGPITMPELVFAIQSCKTTSPGPDLVVYDFVKCLKPHSLNRFLSFINYLWQEGLFPESWHLSLIIPILKPGKPKCNVGSYRPIALTSCLCKLVEKIVSKRLYKFLEQNQLISPTQSGFRKNRNTLDCLTRLESDIRLGFLEGQFTGAVFIDIEKAFDSVWHRGLLMKLEGVGIGGRLLKFIENFLKNRRIQVFHNGSYSQEFHLQCGLPQGSVLSPLLFILYINDIFHPHIDRISYSLFADDCAFWTRTDNLTVVADRLQTVLRGLERWCNVNGLKISPTKTKFIIFTKRKIQHIPLIEFGQNILQLSTQMLQNTLNTTLGGSMSASMSSAQDLESAGRLVDKQLNYDSCFPSLLDMLKVSQQGGATVSGLSENDYPSGGDGRKVRHLHTVRKVPLPSELLHHFQHMQCNCMMGLFPEIKRAWLTIDSDIYVWVYEDGSDLAYFDGLHDTILSVGLVKPKAGVFKPYIEHLLCLTTPSEIVLLGVSFSNPNEGEEHRGMHLLPEPLFSVTPEGDYILTIKGNTDGRIFLGAKDGSLCELVYQAEEGWFSRKCYKVNHSRSSLLSYMLPSFLTLSEDDPINQIEIDNSRHIVYTLSEKGTVCVYDLGSDGKSTTKVYAIFHNNIVNLALQVVKTIDKTNFKNVVSICTIETSESPHVHLVMVTGTGVRLYYSTVPLNSLPSARPSTLTLLHVRLPPGFAANSITHRPTKVHKALYSFGTGVLCASESNESDVVWTVSADQYPYHPSLAESQAVMSVDGYVWALADVTPPLWCTALNPPTPQGTRPPLLVTQHQQEPRQLVLLSASGAHILTTLRPVDQLKLILQECGGPDGASVKDFFSAVSPTQACATALILAMDPTLTSTRIAEWATHALFRYGIPPTSNKAVNMNFTNLHTPGNLTFNPSQVSTPLHHQTPAAQVEVQFSPLHNSLYLYLARILRPIWATNIIKETNVDGKVLLVSKINCEEASFLARHVEQMAKFMHLNQGSGSGGQSLNSSATGFNITAYGNDVWSPERSSLLSLKCLLDQALEVLRLWTILTTHDFSTILAGASKEITDQLRTMSLRDLILSGRDICRQLIMALMNRYHGDNASIDAISGKLREVCKELYRVEDAKLAKANEMILNAKNNNNKEEKEQVFREAVMLYKQIGECVNISGVCSQMASGGWYEGVVDLCLSVASQKDPSGQALRYYKNNEPNDDIEGYHFFRARAECYRAMIDHINQLVGSASIDVAPASPTLPPSRPGPPPPTQSAPSSESNNYAEQMMNLIVSSTDELAHVFLYQWLVDSGRTDRLLGISSSFLEAYLTRSNGQGPLNNILWRYYERNRNYYKAAKTLAQLADQSGDTPLTVRVEYLSRALMCLSSYEMNTATSYADFMLHMEEKKEVARVQLMVLNAIQGLGGGDDVLAPLNSGLLDISTLYEKYAEPWQLWECKLAIVHCAGHCEPQLIQTLWNNIIDSELNSSVNSSINQRIDSLSSKLKSLARMYLNSPNYFPLEQIIRKCELHSVILKADNTAWVVITLQGCGVPITKLIGIYHKLYRSADNTWEVQRAPYHLLSVLAHLISSLTDTPQQNLSQADRRALREQCLDYIAAYLTDLGASADPSAAIISSHLKTCQSKLERS